MTARKTHYKKYYFYDEDGNKDEETWIEVERLDQWIARSGAGYLNEPEMLGLNQQLTFVFDWQDDHGDTQEDDEAECQPRDSRSMEMTEVKLPDERIIKIPTIRQVTMQWINNRGHSEKVLYVFEKDPQQRRTITVELCPVTVGGDPIPESQVEDAPKLKVRLSKTFPGDATIERQRYLYDLSDLLDRIQRDHGTIIAENGIP